MRVAHIPLDFRLGSKRRNRVYYDYVNVEYEILTKSGAWFSYNDEKIAQGREKMRELLKQRPELKAEIEEKIREAHKAAQAK